MSRHDVYCNMMIHTYVTTHLLTYNYTIQYTVQLSNIQTRQNFHLLLKLAHNYTIKHMWTPPSTTLVYFGKGLFMVGLGPLVLIKAKLNATTYWLIFSIVGNTCLIKCQIIVKNAHHKFLKPKVCLFCPTSSSESNCFSLLSDKIKVTETINWLKQKFLLCQLTKQISHRSLQLYLKYTMIF